MPCSLGPSTQVLGPLLGCWLGPRAPSCAAWRPSPGRTALQPQPTLSPNKTHPLPVPRRPTCSPVSPGFPGKPSRPRSPWQRKRMKRRPETHHGQGHGEASRGRVSDWTWLHSPPGAFGYRTSTHTRHSPATECVRGQGACAKGQRNQVLALLFVPRICDRGAAMEPL